MPLWAWIVAVVAVILLVVAAVALYAYPRDGSF